MDSEANRQGPASRERDAASTVRTYWEGRAQVFDGLSARARDIPASIGPDGLFLREGEIAGEYRAGDMVLLEYEAGNYFRVALKAHPGYVVAFHGAEPMEWMRASGLLKRPWSSAISAA